MELTTELIFKEYGHKLTAGCPDEDNDFSIKVNTPKASATYTLTLSEAKELAKWINAHIKNAQKQ